MTGKGNASTVAGLQKKGVARLFVGYHETEQKDVDSKMAATEGLKELQEIPGIGKKMAEVAEVELVILDSAGRERQVDAQRPQVAEHLVRARAIDGSELVLDLVGLRHVALVELVVLLHRARRDAVELTNGAEGAGGELGERHGVLLYYHGSGAAG